MPCRYETISLFSDPGSILIIKTVAIREPISKHSPAIHIHFETLLSCVATRYFFMITQMMTIPKIMTANRIPTCSKTTGSVRINAFDRPCQIYKEPGISTPAIYPAENKARSRTNCFHFLERVLPATMQTNSAMTTERPVGLK